MCIRGACMKVMGLASTYAICLLAYGSLCKELFFLGVRCQVANLSYSSQSHTFQMWWTCWQDWPGKETPKCIEFKLLLAPVLLHQQRDAHEENEGLYLTSSEQNIRQIIIAASQTHRRYLSSCKGTLGWNTLLSHGETIKWCPVYKSYLIYTLPLDILISLGLEWMVLLAVKHPTLKWGHQI